MSENRALAPQSSFDRMLQQADTLVRSGFLPQSINSREKALAIMTMAQELGIGMWAAFNGINIIQGKPTISPQLMLALAEKSGQLEDMRVEGDSSACTVILKRKGRQPHSETFTMQQAAAMNLNGKSNWKSQPAVMLKWRAVSACCRVVFPDVIVGFYTPEEINPDVMVDFDTGEIVQESPRPDYNEAAHQRANELAAQLPPMWPDTPPPAEPVPSAEPRDPDTLADWYQQTVTARRESNPGLAKMSTKAMHSELARALLTLCGGERERRIVQLALSGRNSLTEFDLAEHFVMMDWTRDPRAPDEAAALLALIDDQGEEEAEAVDDTEAMPS